MAKEDDKKPTAAEKGKAKAVNGEAAKDKDAKVEDKKGAATASGGMCSLLDCCHVVLPGPVLMADRRGAQ